MASERVWTTNANLMGQGAINIVRALRDELHFDFQGDVRIACAVVEADDVSMTRSLHHERFPITYAAMKSLTETTPFEPVIVAARQHGHNVAAAQARERLLLVPSWWPQNPAQGEESCVQVITGAWWYFIYIDGTSYIARLSRFTPTTPLH